MKKILSLVIVVLALVSCGNKELKVSTPDVNYDDPALAVLDPFEFENVKVEYDDQKTSVTLICNIKIKEGTNVVFATAQTVKANRVKFEFDVLNEKGKRITTFHPESNQKKDLFNSVVTGDESMIITITKELDKDKYADFKENATTVQMDDVELNISMDKIEKLSEPDDESVYFDDEPDDDEVYASSSSSEDWDAMLDAYDSYVTKYISYLKKASKGDMSALSEYPALMEKAQELSVKMENAQGDMTSAQWARYMKITNRMAQAATEMQ